MICKNLHSIKANSGMAKGLKAQLLLHALCQQQICKTEASLVNDQWKPYKIIFDHCSTLKRKDKFKIVTNKTTIFISC